MTFNWGASLITAMTMLVAALGSAHAGNSFMPTGGRTTQPVGHYEFCRGLPQECRQKTPKKAPAELTRKLWTTLISVNNDVNNSVIPMTDLEIWGREEVWSYPVNGMGDCEDYVLEKRRQLHTMGVPLSDLLITVVRKPDGEGHAVLTVRTSKGDFILDNLRNDVRSWEDTGYRYLKRQASNHTGRWVSIRDDQQVLVGSVR